MSSATLNIFQNTDLANENAWGTTFAVKVPLDSSCFVQFFEGKLKGLDMCVELYPETQRYCDLLRANHNKTVVQKSREFSINAQLLLDDNMFNNMPTIKSILTKHGCVANKDYIKYENKVFLSLTSYRKLISRSTSVAGKQIHELRYMIDDAIIEYEKSNKIKSVFDFTLDDDPIDDTEDVDSLSNEDKEAVEKLLWLKN